MKKVHIEIRIRPTPGTVAEIACGPAMWLCLGLALAGAVSGWLLVLVLAAAVVLRVANGDDYQVSIRR